jgi:hypothetical protein
MLIPEVAFKMKHLFFIFISMCLLGLLQSLRVET